MLPVEYKLLYIIYLNSKLRRIFRTKNEKNYLSFIYSFQFAPGFIKINWVPYFAFYIINYIFTP